MADCTKCPHQKQIQRLQRICLNCCINGKSCGLSNGGVSWVHMDAAANPATVYANRTAPLYQPGGKRDMDAVQSPCNPDERERYLRILQMFAELSWDDAGLVACMMRGMEIDAIAKMRKVKYETIFLRWQKIKKANPAFGALANGLMGCGRGRKPKKELQGDLFKGV